MIDQECFTRTWFLVRNPGHSVGKEPVSELSLSGEPECLSLQKTILTDVLKTGNRLGRRYPGAQAPNKVGSFLPMAEARGILGRVGEIFPIFYAD